MFQASCWLAAGSLLAVQCAQLHTPWCPTLRCHSPRCHCYCRCCELEAWLALQPWPAAQSALPACCQVYNAIKRTYTEQQAKEKRALLDKVPLLAVLAPVSRRPICES